MEKSGIDKKSIENISIAEPIPNLTNGRLLARNTLWDRDSNRAKE